MPVRVYPNVVLADGKVHLSRPVPRTAVTLCGKRIASTDAFEPGPLDEVTCLMCRREIDYYRG